MTVQNHVAVGRRKTSTARVFLKEGSGKFVINNRKAVDYLKTDERVSLIKAPLVTLDMKDKFDIIVNVKGGGTSGQIGAITLGIARAILKYDASLKPDLKKDGYLTRDSRMVERKKPGQPKARKRFQFSKR